MEKMSTLMKKMNVLEIIEMIVELTHDQGITTEMKKGKSQLVSPAKPYIKELMMRLGIEHACSAIPIPSTSTPSTKPARPRISASTEPRASVF